MLGLKIRNLSLVLLLATVVGLAAAQPSPGHELATEDDFGIFGRATSLRKVGAKCKSSSQCRSNVCEGGKCKAKYGGKCKKTSACASGSTCTDGVCTVPLLGPSQPCSNATQCASNSCSTDNSCADAAGNIISCGGDYYNPQAVCGRYDVGHTCANAGECLSGICKSGVCAANSAVGDTCAQQYQCTDGQTCDNGTCKFYADDSRYPFDRCSTDSQCKTKECGYHWNLYTDIGPWYWLYGHSVSDPICRPYFDGEQGCRSDVDCIGLCQDGTCKLVPNGEHCIFTQQCQDQNLCGLDGICYTPTELSNRPAGQPCRGETYDECAGGYCGSQTLTRPTLDGSGNITVYDPLCY
ncbi:hypothetical protein OC861_005946 [Tilletia horrida]|nr:hypothetical protein OC861_005946 [Tilletia horrida]